MPSDARVDRIDPLSLQGLRQRLDFIPAASLLDQIEHAQTEDDCEFSPYSFSDAPNDLNWKSHSILK